MGLEEEEKGERDIIEGSWRGLAKEQRKTSLPK